MSLQDAYQQHCESVDISVAHDILPKHHFVTSKAIAIKPYKRIVDAYPVGGPTQFEMD